MDKYERLNGYNGEKRRKDVSNKFSESSNIKESNYILAISINKKDRELTTQKSA